jgi:cysteine desulfurase
LIDLDHNATTPLSEAARGALLRALGDPRLQGNPASRHGAGQRARALLEEARGRLARILGCTPGQVVFTSGGTEADVLAVAGVARALRRAGRPAGVVSSALEHPAVGAALRALEGDGHRRVLLPVDGSGRIDPEDLARTLAAEPDLGVVALMAAHNELGNLYDVPALVAAARGARPGVFFHTDAVQALGKVPVDAGAWGVDGLAISAHKFGGPKGIGALALPGEGTPEPLLRGGGQERGLRGGTPAPALALAMAVAAEEAAAGAHWPQVRALRERLVAGLGSCEGARILGDPERHIGNTVAVEFAACEAELLAMALDLEGIACSTGAACSSGLGAPSEALQALGLSAARARQVVRFSLGRGNSQADVDTVLRLLPPTLARVRAARPP